ncbi:YdcF family protein [Halanaerobiaceae bacterium Z-7014]|uniref:YdcF family protein n=1 Tax=Halonatronomonas betaini TaxID=2778430 RepID=A0A931AVN5_9FIRM|nr:YdcF family protein [Halonatronomonas betaini]MBF8435638.1 YdcF family protein [Halonatronomonas betaini]
MAKLILSPLFIVLFLNIILGFYGLLKFDIREKGGKFVLLTFIILSLVLGIVSTPAVSVLIARPLETPYGYSELLLPADNIKAVTVLSGGIYQGPAKEFELPGDSTIQRVNRGVKFFLDSEAEYLIMQGRLSEGPGNRMVQLMAEQAIRLGVDEDKIILEHESTNTMEHPYFLRNLNLIAQDAELAVVTSAWHLRRSELAFNNYYENISPVPAEFISYNLPGGIYNFFPQVSGLRRSTRAIHEYIGMIWYYLRLNYY